MGKILAVQNQMHGLFGMGKEIPILPDRIGAKVPSWEDVRKHIKTGEEINSIPEGAEMIPVVGVSFVEGYPSHIYKLASMSRQQGDIFVSLVRNPENPYDKNAIEVRFGEQMLGHLPKEVAARLAPALDKGEQFLASVYQIRISSENPNNPGLDILVDQRESHED